MFWKTQAVLEFRMSFRRITLLFLAMLISCGCGRNETTSSAKATKVTDLPGLQNAKPGTSNDLLNYIERHGSASFRSHDGKWIGTDGDFELTFLPDGIVHVVEYGLDIVEERGRYTIDNDGKLELHLQEFVYDWSQLFLMTDGVSLILLPQDLSRVAQDEKLRLFRGDF